MTPKQTKRDAKGHFISQTKKRHITELANAAKKELKKNAQITKSVKNVPSTNTEVAKQSNKVAMPKVDSIKVLRAELDAVKAGMTKHQQDVITHFLDQNQNISNLKQCLSEHTALINKHYYNLEYLDQISRTYDNKQDAAEDRKTHLWLRKLKDKFIAGSTYPYPLTKEEVESMAIKWAKRPIQISAVYSVYIACLIAAIFGRSAFVTITVAIFGFGIATALAFYIWAPTRE